MIKSLSLLIFSSAILFTNVAFAACTSPTGSEGDVIYSAAAKQLQFCNGTTWVNTGATVQTVGGGGQPSFSGLTTSTYNGNRGGIFGMDQVCNSEYSGSRMLRFSELKYLYSVLPTTDDYYVYCDQPECNGSSSPNLHNCRGWNTGSGSNATTISASGIMAYSASCATALKVACVTD